MTPTTRFFLAQDENHRLHVAIEEGTEGIDTLELERLRKEVARQQEEILDLRSGRIATDVSTDVAHGDGADANVVQLEREIEDLRKQIADGEKEHADLVEEMQSAYADKAGADDTTPGAGGLAALMVGARPRVGGIRCRDW